MRFGGQGASAVAIERETVVEDTNAVKLAEDTIDLDDLQALSDWLLGNPQLTKGPLTEQFERDFSRVLSSRYSLFVNSGSSANLLIAAALKASGRLRNRKVVCPAVAWVTTLTPFTQLGFDVVLCDADQENLGVDVAKLRLIFEKENPSVLVIVHVLGHANDMDQIVALCEEFDVLLVEDSCEALGSEIERGQKLGTIGLAGSFSFYFGHHISTIEGGMVVTGDYDLFQVMKSIRSHGWTRDLDSETKSELLNRYEIDDFRSLYTFFYEGFNLRSTDLQAFIGLGQLVKLGKIVETRRDNHREYAAHLPDFWTQSSSTAVLSSFAFGTAVSNRSEVAIALATSGIECRPLICGNLSRHPFWSRYDTGDVFPMADFIHDHGIYLPNHALIGAPEIRRVAKVFRAVAKPIFPRGQGFPDSA